MENIFKQGDRVFDIRYGWGVVEEVITAVVVKFDSCVMDRNHYWGRLLGVLSFTEYTLNGFSQERPEELPKKGQVVWTRGEFPSEWEIGHFFEKKGNEYRTYMSPSLKGWNNKGIEIRTTNPYEDEQ